MRGRRATAFLGIAAAGLLQLGACSKGGETTGGGGGSSTDCKGDPSSANISDSCAVFVQADAKGTVEDGTEAHPFKTLQKAVQNAPKKRVYACAAAPFLEAVTISAPLELYGGFDCAKGWTWKASATTTLGGPADAVALTITKDAASVKIVNFAIQGANATKPGGSSIAMAADDLPVELVHLAVTAGDGVSGDDGLTPSDVPINGADAPPMIASIACVAPNAVAGGDPGKTMCEDGDTGGGLGGLGGITGMTNGDGGPGGDGTPVDPMKGKGGAGQDTANDCVDGLKGANGTAGVAGASDTTPGTLTLTGIKSDALTDGKPGTRGQGGGGGGGAKSGVFCKAGMGKVDGVGASGGGGGAGGCGGKGGGGGKAGGSSIAILSLGKQLKLTSVTLHAGNGGNGGNGADGQPGGTYGHGADGGTASGNLPSVPGCQGGAGGAGGPGGPGGGGRGGHSVGIAYASAPDMMPTLKDFTGGTAGKGGAPVSGSPVGGGADGSAGGCWDFAANASCSQ